jgi:hypothetical protein
MQTAQQEKIMAADLKQLEPITIRFENKEDAVKGFYALLTSGMPVRTTQDEKYIINQVQCSLLQKKGIKYLKE